MRKRIARIFIACGFLAMFLTYFVGTTLFSHVHLMDGTVIVHSHFYDPGEKEKPLEKRHSHSPVQLIQIYYLSFFDKTTPSFEPVSLIPVAFQWEASVFFYRECFSVSFCGEFPSRGPPFFPCC